MDNLESKAESIADKDAQQLIKNSQTHLKISPSSNYKNPRIKINTGFQNNNPVIKQYDAFIVGDGFNKGKSAGYWVGRKIRSYACNRFSLECNTRSYAENE
ncbi:hypothetical protein [Anabaena sp. UHCC 0451]|uniref:hypothetical protein n=1 Tax=Anabaena sp. UHCC 0451 TaxID=2055235 RepID=UPI002B1F0DF8|nr:hypothetical protein [Anabaena sp. UHCC 0451]MEA5575993.1 hypothetical protein [Anabaena sp. UHCC 0451]